MTLSSTSFRLLFRSLSTHHVIRNPFLCGTTVSKFQHAFYFSKSRIVKKEPFLSMRKAVIAVCCFGIGGGVYGYMTAVPDRKRILEPKFIENIEPIIKFDIPEIEPSRKIVGPADDIGLHLTLYQYQTCPFCCKVRAFLGYYGIPYDVVEVNPVLRQQLRFSKYKKVPILIAHDQTSDEKYQLNDSSVVISIMGTFLMDIKSGLQNALKYYVPVSYMNEEGKQISEVTNKYFLMYGEKNPTAGKSYEEISRERKWRRWADAELVHILSPNIYRTYDEAKQAFNYFSVVGEWEKNFSYVERLLVIYVGATAMYYIGKKLKKKYSLKDDVRQSLYDACNLWIEEIGPKAKFLGGETPNIADLEVYGLLSSIEGCPAFQDALSRTNVGKWYYSVKTAVEKHHGHNSFNLLKSRV